MRFVFVMSLKLYILMLSMLWIQVMEFSSKKLSLSNSSIPTLKFSQNNGQTLEVLFSRFDFSRLLHWLLFLVDAKEENLSWLFFFWFLPFFSFFKSLLMAKESLGLFWHCFSADEVDGYGCGVWCFGGFANLGSVC